MLETIGVDSIDELFEQYPSASVSAGPSSSSPLSPNPSSSRT